MAAGINEVIEGLFTELMPAAKEAVVLPAQIITVVAIILHVFNGLAEEGTLEKLKDNWLKTLIPPLIVAFLVFNYGMMFDYILELFKALDKETMTFSDKTSVELSNLRDTKDELTWEQTKTTAGVAELVLSGGTAGLRDIFDSALESLMHIIIELVYLAVYILYKMTSFLNIYFLCMFGPLQVALYFTPWYKGSLPDWFGKLITAFMWMPILNIVKMVVEKTQIYFIKIDIAQMKGSGTGIMGSQIGQEDWLEYVAILVGIFMMSQVSNFASFILSSSGIGGENGMFGKVVGGSATSAGSALSATAGTVAGPMGSMVGGITKGVAKGAVRGAGRVAGGISNIFS